MKLINLKMIAEKATEEHFFRILLIPLNTLEKDIDDYLGEEIDTSKFLVPDNNIYDMILLAMFFKKTCLKLYFFGKQKRILCCVLEQLFKTVTRR
jgi:hypothetical protein